MEVYIGIPCYQVASSIRGVLERVRAAKPDVHVLLLNDGSSDNLKEAIAGFDTSAFLSFTYKEHERNSGYGAAQKSIFREFQAQSQSPDDLLVFVHGDGQTVEAEIGRFVETAAQYPHLDAVLGSRMLNSPRVQMRGGRPFFKILADYILTFVENRAYGLRLSTYASGFRAFRRKGIDKMDFTSTSNAHVFDTETLILFRFFGIKYKEIRVQVVRNDTGLSANHLWKYAKNTLELLFKYAFRWRWYPTKRHLIVNADDYGYANSINAAVYDAFAKGIISSTSIMANGTAFQDAAARARSGGYLDKIGVHVNLTEGTPLGTKYKTITGRDGEFLPISRLILASLLGRIDREEVLREVRLQIEAVRKAGIPVSHLDTHQWSQVLPEISDALYEVATAYEIPCVRNVREHVPLRALIGAHPRSILNSLAVALLRLRSHTPLTAQMPERYYGILETGHYSFTSAFAACIRSLPPGTSEFMCHIGSESPTDLAHSYYRKGRHQEFRALDSEQARKALSGSGVALISYAEFARM